MKIEGPNRTSAPDKAKKKDGVSSGDGSFGRMVAGETADTGMAHAAHSIARLDALLGVQAAEDPAARAARNRMTHRADSILDELEKIRAGLLTGTLTVGHVLNIADVVASHREKILDPRLTAILDEIDLRAQIEIAKMRKVLDNAAPL